MAIPERSSHKTEDTWDLSKLFSSDSEWESSLARLKTLIPGIEKFRGTLGQSVDTLLSCLEYMKDIEMLEERVAVYAHLRMAEDMGNSASMDRYGRFMSVSTNISTAACYQNPEIQSIPESTITQFLADEKLAPYRLVLDKVLRFKPHVLSDKEERLMALYTEPNQTAKKTFSALSDVDLDFGTIETPDGPKTLSQASFSSFLLSQDRSLRENAYRQFYQAFDGHRNTFASLYNGNIQLDVCKARARNYPSARAMALFPDNVPEEVYDNLVATVRSHLPSLHRYYRLRKKTLGVDSLRHWDLHVPLVKTVSVKNSYEQAVDLIIPALEPLGKEYCTTLRNGLLSERWVDRYENKGKRSGAFSAGSYFGNPYILMNYKDDVLRDVFTLAHEGGHSMHSFYSVHNNPFQYYSYTIFEAEVASTFNEQLLANYLLHRDKSIEMKAYLTGKQVDDIIATIYRQTMFAEYENLCHQKVEKGEALTVDSLRAIYRKLLTDYFGPDMVLEDVSDLEGLRIPHFYRAFYVYKYATGLSASINLSQRVLSGGTEEKERYLGFLKSGGSKYPLDSLKIAGVDMSNPEPIQHALGVFDRLVTELESLPV